MKERSTGERDAGLLHLTNSFQSCRKTLAKLVARIVRPQDIEDIVQETYIRIFQASKIQPIFHARSFMLKTARNLALNHVARADALNYVARSLDDDESEGAASAPERETAAPPESELQAQEEFLLFCRSLRDLSSPCRRAFILRKVYGLSQRQVAQELGLSESTVEKHIARGITTASEYLRLHGFTRPASLPMRRRSTIRASHDE